MPERYEELANCSSKSEFDTILGFVATDAVWQADCLRTLKRVKEIDAVKRDLISNVEKSSVTMHLNRLATKELLIEKMASAVKEAGFDAVPTTTAKKLAELKKLPENARNEAYDKLIDTLLDSMR